MRPLNRLLSVSSDAKTIKGQKRGFLTGVLYLAPHTISGFQVCPKASPGCRIACLYTAGRGVYSNTQQSRINKTQHFFTAREAFMDHLVKEIEALIRKASREKMTPVIRLNGTSDLPWEKFPVTRKGKTYASIMEAFPRIQFYDYTKIRGRTKAISLKNYHLTFSLAENNDADATKALEEGYNVAVVMRVGRKESKPDTWSGYPVHDGDETDLRFLDPPGHIIALYPKGTARHDTIGFVRPKNGAFYS